MSSLRMRKGRRIMRHVRLRQKVKGTPERPRLAVFRSLNHVSAQIVDDSQGITLVAASSLESEIRKKMRNKPKTEASKLVGTLLAERAKKKGFSAVIFDRGGHKYHGRVKALAEAVREKGLVF